MVRASARLVIYIWVVCRKRVKTPHTVLRKNDNYALLIKDRGGGEGLSNEDPRRADFSYPRKFFFFFLLLFALLKIKFITETDGGAGGVYENAVYQGSCPFHATQ